MTSHVESAEPGQERPPALVLAAFRQAKDRGKEDWWRMTSPVLKNRMLQLDPERLEELVGDQTFRAWLEGLSSLITTPDGKHALVELPEHLRASLVAREGEGRSPDPQVEWKELRVRPDLWRAIVDYKSDTRYVWDGASGKAVEAGTPDARPALPTLTPEDLRELRTTFAASVRDSDLTEWVAGLGATEGLPRRHWGRWNEALKKEVVGRLQGWFREQGVPAPEITKQATSTRADPDAMTRDLLRRLAESMDPSELERTTVPLSAVVRLLSK